MRDLPHPAESSLPESSSSSGSASAVGIPFLLLPPPDPPSVSSSALAGDPSYPVGLPPGSPSASPGAPPAAAWHHPVDLCPGGLPSSSSSILGLRRLHLVAPGSLSPSWAPPGCCSCPVEVPVGPPFFPPDALKIRPGWLPLLLPEALLSSLPDSSDPELERSPVSSSPPP